MYHLPLLPGYVPTVNVRSSAPSSSPSGEEFIADLTEAEENGYVGGYFSPQESEGVTETALPYEHPESDAYLQSSPETLRQNLATTPASPSPARAMDLAEASLKSAPAVLEPASPGQMQSLPSPSPLSPHMHLSPSIPPSNNTTPLTPPTIRGPVRRKKDSHTSHNIAEVILFSYGVVVFFNLSSEQERLILDDLDTAELLNKKLKESEWEVEGCHFELDSEAERPRIYNDFFSEYLLYMFIRLTTIAALKSPSHLLKLSISHALAQSTLLARYESQTSHTLSSPSTLSIPHQLSTTGSISMRRREALRLSGRLFKLKRDVNLVSNVLDVPELFWSEASLGELYVGVREYLEIGERVEELNRSLEVVRDLVSSVCDGWEEKVVDRRAAGSYT